MDLNAACAGFTYGLVTAAGLVALGMDRVLLIGAETLTRATNWADRTNAFLFGDGAGAVVVEAVPGEGSLLGWDLGRRRIAGAVAVRRSRLRDGDARPGGVPQGGPGHGRLRPAVARAGQGHHRRHRPVRAPPGQHPDHGCGRATASDFLRSGWPR